MVEQGLWILRGRVKRACAGPESRASIVGPRQQLLSDNPPLEAGGPMLRLLVPVLLACLLAVPVTAPAADAPFDLLSVMREELDRSIANFAGASEAPMYYLQVLGHRHSRVLTDRDRRWPQRPGELRPPLPGRRPPRRQHGTRQHARDPRRELARQLLARRATSTSRWTRTRMPSAPRSGTRPSTST